MRKHMGILAMGILTAVCLRANTQPERVLVEAERFAEAGGWKADAQFVESMGSPYLIAHGLGVPVSNAVTLVDFPVAGEYRVWARTRNWVPAYSNDVAPGRFQIAVDGAVLPQVLGAEGDPVGGVWHWQSAGLVTVAATALVELKDLTGFDGRCDAVAFIRGDDLPPPNDATLAAWRTTVLGESLTPTETQSFDCVVVGAGIGGCATALAAARSGVRVALVQDRPVVGGNASQEIRVATRGEMRYKIVDEIDTTPYGNTDDRTTIGDTNRLAVIQAEPNITLFMPWRAYAVGTNATRRITHVDVQQVGSGLRRRLQAPLFVDATGDAWIGYWAGADFRQGREARAEFNEPRAPTVADRMTMGNSLMWTSRDAGVASAFPTNLPWAQVVAGTAANTGGDWNWEYGMRLDTVYDAEQIRDHLLQAIYGNFANAKKNGANPNRVLHWVPYVAGKRESRRLLGDHILTELDLEQGAYFDDAVITTDWGIDLHFETAISYRSDYTKGTAIAKPSYVPYRCFYSRNVPNLFMAGRNFSTTHVGIGSPRVMNTIGQMGVVVGYAAAICKNYGIEPRDVYRIKDRLVELQARLTGNWISTYAWPSLTLPTTAGTVILDNTNAAPAVRIFGDWTPSTSDPYYYGSNYLLDGNTGKNKKRIAYTPSLATGTRYVVAFRSSSGSNKAKNLPVWVCTNATPGTASASGWGYLRNAQPTAVNAAGEIWVGRVAASDYMRGLLQFDLAAIPSNAVIVSAVLKMRIGSLDTLSKTGFVGVDGLRAYLVTEPFFQSQATWNNRASATPWTTTGGTFNAASPVGIIATPTDPSLVTVGQVFAFPAGAALNEAVQAASKLRQPLGLVVRTPVLESTWPDRKLYRFDTAYLEVRYHAPVLPAHYTIDQTVGGGLWKALGTYACPSEGISVIVGNDGTTAYAVADAVQFQPEGDTNVYQDYDGDGFVSDWERYYGFFSTGYSDADDTDGDGLLDTWERYYFLSETAASLTTDNDGDGRSNFIEYMTRTDPTDSASRFDMFAALNAVPPEVKPETMELAWPSHSNLTYRIEVSTNLTTFVPLIQGIPATPPQNRFEVQRTRSSEFFRIVIEND